MANSEVSQNERFVYILTLGNKITAPSVELDPPKLELIQGDSLAVKNQAGQTYKVYLNGVKINKKIYQPNEIEAELTFIQETTDTSGKSTTKAPSPSDVSELLLQRQVKAEILTVPGGYTIDKARAEKEGVTIATSYYVFEVDPMLKRETNGTSMYVKMSIFSMDKLMTLNKYSKAYVARKLGSGILKPESLNFGTESEGVPLVKSNPYHLRFLRYTDDEIVVGPDGKQQTMSILSEFIQPYLVQYNESFYDFLVRSANRCGEFLFFEDGSLILGLPSADSDAEPTTISGYLSVTIQTISSDPLSIDAYTRDSMKNGDDELEDLNQTVIKKQSTGFPKDAFSEKLSSNAELANDEYIFPLYKDKFSNLKREAYYDNLLYKSLNAVKSLTTGDDVVSSAVGFGVGEGMLTVTGYMQANTTNSLQEEAHLKPYKGKDEQYDDEKVVQFASLKKEGWPTVNFYNGIHSQQLEQQRHIICIDMGTNVVHVKLGQKINVDGMDGTYVVIQVSQISDTMWTRDYDKYNHTSSDKYSDKRSLKIYAIPAYTVKDKLQFIPPVHPVPIIRKAGPQTAFVTDNNDPKYQGRVRVAYTWQTLGKADKEQLEEAENALTKAEEERDNTKAWCTEMLAKQALLIKEVEELEKYFAASESERKKMLEDKQKKYDETKEVVDDLKEELAKLEKEKKKKEEWKVSQEAPDWMKKQLATLRRSRPPKRRSPSKKKRWKPSSRR